MEKNTGDINEYVGKYNKYKELEEKLKKNNEDNINNNIIFLFKISKNQKTNNYELKINDNKYVYTDDKSLSKIIKDNLMKIKSPILQYEFINCSKKDDIFLVTIKNKKTNNILSYIHYIFYDNYVNNSNYSNNKNYSNNIFNQYFVRCSNINYDEIIYIDNKLKDISAKYNIPIIMEDMGSIQKILIQLIKNYDRISFYDNKHKICNNENVSDKCNICNIRKCDCIPNNIISLNELLTIYYDNNNYISRKKSNRKTYCNEYIINIIKNILRESNINKYNDNTDLIINPNNIKDINKLKTNIEILKNNNDIQECSEFLLKFNIYNNNNKFQCHISIHKNQLSAMFLDSPIHIKISNGINEYKRDILYCGEKAIFYTKENLNQIFNEKNSLIVSNIINDVMNSLVNIILIKIDLSTKELHEITDKSTKKSNKKSNNGSYNKSKNFDTSSKKMIEDYKHELDLINKVDYTIVINNNDINNSDDFELENYEMIIPPNNQQVNNNNNKNNDLFNQQVNYTNNKNNKNNDLFNQQVNYTNNNNQQVNNDKIVNNIKKKQDKKIDILK
jgi:hypothetical protein